MLDIKSVTEAASRPIRRPDDHVTWFLAIKRIRAVEAKLIKIVEKDKSNWAVVSVVTASCK